MPPRFTIGQILLATVAIGCGLAVARLPDGNPSDVLLVATGVMLSWSLVRRLLVILVSRPELFPADRPSATIVSLLLVITTGILATGVVLRYSAAANWIRLSDDPFYHFFLFDFGTLSIMLVMVGMLVAIGLGEPGWDGSDHVSRRRKYFTIAAVLCVPIAAVAYWCNGLLVWLLVYYALCGVELAYSYGMLSPPPLNFARGAQLYVVGASLSLPLVFIHLAVISGCVVKWSNSTWRYVLVPALLALVLIELAYVVWLAGPGVRALSPYYGEVLALPAWQSGALTVAMILLISAWLAFRLTARRQQAILQPPDQRTPRLFHERFVGSLAVGLAAISCLAFRYVNLERSSFSSMAEEVAYDATRPESLMMFAAAFGGFGLALKRWPCKALSPMLPHVNLPQFTTLVFAIATGIVLGGIMIASISFALLLILVGTVG